MHQTSQLTSSMSSQRKPVAWMSNICSNADCTDPAQAAHKPVSMPAGRTWSLQVTLARSLSQLETAPAAAEAAAGMWPSWWRQLLAQPSARALQPKAAIRL